MMSGYVSNPSRPSSGRPRHYRVVARNGGWSIVLGDACTRPFGDRAAAMRIAHRLQSQADRLNRSLEPH